MDKFKRTRFSSSTRKLMALWFFQTNPEATIIWIVSTYNLAIDQVVAESYLVASAISASTTSSSNGSFNQNEKMRMLALLKPGRIIREDQISEDTDGHKPSGELKKGA